MANTNPIAWRVAIALSLAQPAVLIPDWALAAAGRPRICAPGTCLPEGMDWDEFWAAYSPPWGVGAYLADCKRRGVEPGPLPSLTCGTRDGGVYWLVESDAHGVQVVIKVGAHEVAVAPRGLMVHPSFGDNDDHIKLSSLVAVAVKAMGGMPLGRMEALLGKG